MGKLDETHEFLDPLRQKLLSCIIKRGTCWEWGGSKISTGYGNLTFRRNGYLVHRVAYVLFNGPLFAHECVLHHCDNPPCFNPSHLFKGTIRDNLLDARDKGLLNNPRLTHCKKYGHPFVGKNVSTNYDANGKFHRRCRTCKVIRLRMWRAKQRG